MAKKNPNDKIVVVDHLGLAHVQPAANEPIVRGYNNKLPPDKQSKIYPYEEGKAITDYNTGKTSQQQTGDATQMVDKLVKRLDSQEEKIKKLEAENAKLRGSKSDADGDGDSKKTVTHKSNQSTTKPHK